MTNWIPVAERLPKIGERVLASYKSGDVVTAYRESDDEEKGWVDECQDLIVGTAECSPQWQIVAWMPLPAPYMAHKEINAREMLSVRLGGLLHERRIKQKDLAEMCGLSQNDVSCIVGNNARSENVTIGIEKMLAIANALGISIDWLVGRTDYREGING